MSFRGVYMVNDESYTTDDIARLLKVSKLTVYDLIKKGELKSYRVGRQIRVDARELEEYKVREQEVKTEPASQRSEQSKEGTSQRSLVISGQDSSLDILSRSLEEKSFRPLRSYRGSLDSLMAMYDGKADVVSTHLFDGDSKEYNIPYVRKILVSMPFVVIKFIERQAGFYVAKNNPKQIKTWEDLGREDIAIVNREHGAGARVLLDEQLRLHQIKRQQLSGYHTEETSHLAVASAISNGHADVGIGIENAAQMADITFIPMIKESYDLVILNSRENKSLIKNIVDILTETTFKHKLQSLGYTTDHMGDVLWEQ